MKKDSTPNSEEFFIAVEKGDIKKVASFLEAGIDPNLKDEDGLTALHRASIRGGLAIVKFLIEKGANINAQTNEGYFSNHSL
ncbi:MAG: ankyrin repeat domain-containing protein [Oligoflexia bacterium]|nr:ankyrin repeat domain-containing protein [Oligoflexia bacterium]